MIAPPGETTRGLWDFNGTVPRQLDGFMLEAVDGRLGEVVAAERERGRCFVVAQGGGWIERRMIMLPAGLVELIDPLRRALTVSCTRAQVEEAPPFEGDRYRDRAYRIELGDYYLRLRRSHGGGAGRPVVPSAAQAGA